MRVDEIKEIDSENASSDDEAAAVVVAEEPEEVRAREIVVDVNSAQKTAIVIKKKKSLLKSLFGSTTTTAKKKSKKEEEDDEDEEDDDADDVAWPPDLEHTDEEEEIMESNRLEKRILSERGGREECAFSAVHAQFYTKTAQNCEKFVKPMGTASDTGGEGILFKAAAERLRVKVLRAQSHRKLEEHKLQQLGVGGRASSGVGGRKTLKLDKGKFLKNDERNDTTKKKMANLRSCVANADSAINIGLKGMECMRRDSVFQNQDFADDEEIGQLNLVEKDLRLDGEDEAVKRFLLATRVIVGQIAEILRPRGPGFNEKSPSSFDDAGEATKINENRKSAEEETSFNFGKPFDAYDSSDEDNATCDDEIPLPPPLGSHVIRCVATPRELDFIRSVDKKPLSVYFQENNAFNFQEIRTADHFLDGSTQNIRSSTKIQAIPRAEMVGASLLIHLDMPEPMEREEGAPKDICREGCYIELNGASGHPDYLQRWRRRLDCPKSEQSIDTEVYTFTLPTLKAHNYFLRKPIGELCGDIKIACEKTGLEAILKFHEYDAEFSPPLRNIVTGVVTKKDSKEVKRMLFGTWDSVIFWEDPNGGKDRNDLSVLFAEAETLSKGVLYDDLKHAVSQRGFVRPLSTSTSVRSLATAIKCPQTMSREKLWMCIQSSIRYSKRLGHVGNFVAKVLLGKETLEVQDEYRFTGTKDLDMGYEMTTIVTTKLPFDAEPPLPRIWEPRASPSPKKGHVESCGLFRNKQTEEAKKETTTRS